MTRDTQPLFISTQAVRAFYFTAEDYLRVEGAELLVSRRALVESAREELQVMMTRGSQQPYLAADTLLVLCEIGSHVLQHTVHYPLSTRRRSGLRAAVDEGRETWTIHQKANAAFHDATGYQGCLGPAWQVIGLMLGICAVAVVLGCAFSLL